MTSNEHARTAPQPAQRTAPDCSDYVEVATLGAGTTCAVTLTPYRPVAPRTPAGTAGPRRQV
jgi:hypothetical protein